MILKYPLSKDKLEWNKKKFGYIPNKFLNSSGYKLIAVAESMFDVYVAFTNEEQDQVWIEKTHKLMSHNLLFDNFVQIEDKEEFNKAHRFFIKEGVLDGPKNT